MCFQGFGRGDIEGATRLLEQLADDEPPGYRARAIQSVGTNSCYELEELKKLPTDDKIAKIWGRLVDEDVDDEISLRRIKARDSQVS